MLKKIKKFFTTSTEMKIAQKLLQEINFKRGIYSQMSDEELKNQTNVFKERLQNGETLEDIRVEAFAAVREATKRVLNKFPYDVQILGGLLLDQGSVAEMKTGEGKTITSIAPVYLNALSGKGVIVSTVNEYLSERDAVEMGEVHKWMGLSVGINKAQMDPFLKKQAYACDITYSVHSELGFDYLRDNMVKSKHQKVQRGLNFVLIDEVDSILIDEAKTPLIISGGEKSSSNMYFASDQFVRTLVPDDYLIDAETKSVKLTDSGINKANAFFNLVNLYDIENSELVHRIQNALRAHKIMQKDVEYIVREGKIELVDTFTGRVMEGRSYSEGLQQSLQAKEMLEIESETKTLATITYQNFFRMFKKLAGMTGTAKTEEQEFIDIYNIRVNVVDTNRPIQRIDDEDLIFGSFKAKYKAIVEEIKKKYAEKQPVLVGTSQVNESEYLHELLKKEGIPHTVLNAKQNESEADIISRAGEVGAITIATNMAGRGTDIKPTPAALEKGGLYVLGTDRAESRRIDNQLKGRAGRQGDVGYSRFFLSIEDQLMARFSNYELIKETFATADDNPIPGKAIHRHFRRSQKKIEGFNYDNRKSVLSFDDVIRQQRDLVYTQRDIILQNDVLDHYIQRIFKRTIDNFMSFSFILKANNEVDYHALTKFLNDNFSKISLVEFSYEELSQHHFDELKEYLYERFNDIYFNVLRVNMIENESQELAINLEREILLTSLDNQWQSHIDILDRLRHSANLVQYSQKNPYQIFTEEASKKFEQFINESADMATIHLFTNRKAMKIIYEYHTLSNGETVRLDSQLTPEYKQSVIDNLEQQIEARRQAEQVPQYKEYTLINGTVFRLPNDIPFEQHEKIIQQQNEEIVRSEMKRQQEALDKEVQQNSESDAQSEVPQNENISENTGNSVESGTETKQNETENS
ncbi:preprotein translocase subunit SecA [Mycoplasma procyoni]|uniref:preprotein translocase subunit SecA n=1 Tax=Mycoplasma procyoni TaxID=568784 RepID=UPI00197B374B|nr:preprotein translocase subunit SecA [Mycoplasma procyoni]MBN3534454.1 preprotein translocase subunit SecA [Mycoplasma procyoni]